MNTAAFLQSLPIMAMGMAGIFLVTGIIIACIYLLNKFLNTPAKKEADAEWEEE